MPRIRIGGKVPRIVNPLAILVNDIHVSSTANGLDPTTPSEAAALASHLISLTPAAIINLGDNGEQAHDGNAQEYKDNFHDAISAASIRHLCLRGNHDADVDSAEEAASETFTFFDGVFPTLPYHDTFDWRGPNIRFILPHTYIQHPPTIGNGFWWIDSAERTWAAAMHAARRAGWKSLFGTHPPSDNASFGNGIRDAFGGTEWRAWLASEADGIVACAHGHRHIVPFTSSLSGITHINGACGSYWTGWSHGGFMKLLWSQAANTLTITPHRARTPFDALTITDFPLVIDLAA